MKKYLRPTPAALIEAVVMLQNVSSFDAETICQAVCEIGSYSDDTISPEEAEKRGIDLFQVLDRGVSARITLGQELRDWRIFCQEAIDQMVVLGDYVWLQNHNCMVWQNPRICREIQKLRMSGVFIQCGMPQEFPKKADLLAVYNVKREQSRMNLEYQPQIPVAPWIPQSGAFADLTTSCLYVKRKREPELLANFIPEPLYREYHFDAKGERTVFYRIRITLWQFMRDITVSERDLDHLYALIQKEVDAAVIYGMKADFYLAQYIRSRLPSMEMADITVFTDSGWQFISNKWIYGRDDRADVWGNYFKTGRCLEAEEYSMNQSWEIFQQLLNVAQDQKVTSVAILYTFLALSFTIFQEAGFPLQFLLYLVGTTGSLKTSFAKVVFDIFTTTDGLGEVSHTFSDTITAVELYVGKLKDEVGIIDDLELGDSESESRRQQEIFNLIVRMVGDLKGKNRSNPALKDVKAKAARGLVALTGEQSLGKQSTRLRIVEVELGKGVIRGDRLAVFQENPKMWRTICGKYIEFLERNFETAVQYVETQSRSLRRQYQRKFAHLRTVDQLVAFAVIKGLVTEFWSVKMENAKEEVKVVMDGMLNNVEEILLKSELTDEESNPGIRFLKDLDAMTGAGEIKIAPDFDTFVNMSGCIGFRDEFSDLFIVRDQAYQAVTAYEARMKRRFAFDVSKVLKSMEEMGLIYKFKNGKASTFSVRKQGQIFIKINSDQMEKILTEDKE